MNPSNDFNSSYIEIRQEYDELGMNIHKAQQGIKNKKNISKEIDIINEKISKMKKNIKFITKDNFSNESLETIKKLKELKKYLNKLSDFSEKLKKNNAMNFTENPSSHDTNTEKSTDNFIEISKKSLNTFIDNKWSKDNITLSNDNLYFSDSNLTLSQSLKDLKTHNENNKNNFKEIDNDKNINSESFESELENEILTSLYDAVDINDLKKIREIFYNNPELIEHEDEEGKTLLFWAIAEDKFELVELLIEVKANIEVTEGVSLLQLAALKGNFSICELLIKNGANINHKDHEGETVFHIAASKNNLDICQLILKSSGNNFNINEKNNRGETALLIAAFMGNLEMCQFLQKNHANMNCIDNENHNALHCAAKNEHFSICTFIINYIKEINSKDSLGFTALHYAAEVGNLKICRLLLNNHADIDCLTNRESTPLVLATIYKHYDVADYLIDNGANLFSKDLEDFNFLSILTNLQEKTSNEFLKKLRKKNEIFYQCAKDYRQRKLLANISQVDGTTDIVFDQKTLLKPISNINLLAWRENPSYLWKKIAKSWDLFSKKFPEIINSKENASSIIEIYREAITHEVNHDFTERFQVLNLGKRLFLKTGFIGHFVGVLFDGDQCILCNRGAGRKQFPYQAFKFDKQRLNENVLKKIDGIKQEFEEEYQDFYNYELPFLLKFSKDMTLNAIEKIPLPFQKVGNCAWANSSGMIPVLLFLDTLKKNPEIKNEEIKILLKKQFSLFEQWESFTLIQTLDRYLDKISKRSMIRPDYTLLSTILKKNFPKEDSEMSPKILEMWKKGLKKFNQMQTSKSFKQFL